MFLLILIFSFILINYIFDRIFGVAHSKYIMSRVFLAILPFLLLSQFLIFLYSPIIKTDEEIFLISIIFLFIEFIIFLILSHLAYGWGSQKFKSNFCIFLYQLIFVIGVLYWLTHIFNFNVGF